MLVDLGELDLVVSDALADGVESEIVGTASGDDDYESCGAINIGLKRRVHIRSRDREIGDILMHIAGRVGISHMDFLFNGPEEGFWTVTLPFWKRFMEGSASSGDKGTEGLPV